MVAFLCPLPLTILPLTTDCLHHRPSQFPTLKEHIQFFAVKEFKDIRNATYGLELGSVDAPVLVIGQTAAGISETDADGSGGTTEPLAPRKVDIADFILASGVLVFSFWVSNYLVPDLVFRDTVFRDQVNPAPTNQTIEGDKASINVSKPGSAKGQQRGKV